MTVQGSGHRIEPLDGLRGFAFLSVFFYHLGAIPGYNRGVVALYNEIVGWGFLGVDLFFVISGFIITTLLLKEKSRNSNISIRKFFQRRTLRIWPLFYLVLAISAIANILFAKPDFDTNLYVQVLQRAYLPLCCFLYILPLPVTELIAALMKQTSFPTINSIAPLWSVCVEEQFYLVWPWLIAFVRSQRQLVVGILLVVAACEYLRWNGTTGWSGAFYLNPLSRVAPLAIGAMLAIGSHSANALFQFLANHSGKIFLAMFAVSLLVFTYPGHALGPAFVTRCPDYLIVVTALGATLLASLKNPYLVKIFSHRSIRELGKYTYCMYLLHFLVIRIARPFDWANIQDPIIRHLLWTAISFGVTLAIAVISWRFIEEPLSRMRARLSA